MLGAIQAEDNGEVVDYGSDGGTEESWQTRRRQREEATECVRENPGVWTGEGNKPNRPLSARCQVMVLNIPFVWHSLP
ncbi:hypothetical protein RRG08_043428 [Elysia crispata]|uniref:Uncharacterized protein n=1 Tax=Elysia crispata TaxID=231223 RepID=A0AAE1D140_9GAST|nr:hypothetical protein RRG08_043428 [Elysia crispata]